MLEQLGTFALALTSTLFPTRPISIPALTCNSRDYRKTACLPVSFFLYTSSSLLSRKRGASGTLWSREWVSGVSLGMEVRWVLARTWVRSEVLVL